MSGMMPQYGMLEAAKGHLCAEDDGTRNSVQSKQLQTVRSTSVDWSSFPLFPLNQIQFLEVEDLSRTRNELNSLTQTLNGSTDPADQALLTYIEKEQTMICKRCDILAASERVHLMLAGQTKPISELKYGNIDEVDARPEVRVERQVAKPIVIQRPSAVKPTIKKQVFLATVEKPAIPSPSVRVISEEPSVVSLNSREEVDGSPRSTRHIREEDTVSRYGKVRAKVQTTQKKRATGNTWGKTFVVFSDGSKKKRRKQQEQERIRMQQIAKAKAKRRKDREEQKQSEKKKLARIRLAEREKSRVRWEKERLERIAHAEKLAKELKERKKHEAARKVKQAVEDKAVTVEDCGDEEVDEEELMLQEALDEERAANEDDTDREQIIKVVQSSVEDTRESSNQEDFSDSSDEESCVLKTIPCVPASPPVEEEMGLEEEYYPEEKDSEVDPGERTSTVADDDLVSEENSLEVKGGEDVEMERQHDENKEGDGSVGRHIVAAADTGPDGNSQEEKEEDCDAAIAEPESGVQEHNETSDDLPLNIIDMEHQSDDKKQKQEDHAAAPNAVDVKKQSDVTEQKDGDQNAARYALDIAPRSNGQQRKGSDPTTPEISSIEEKLAENNNSTGATTVDLLAKLKADTSSARLALDIDLSVFQEDLDETASPETLKEKSSVDKVKEETPVKHLPLASDSDDDDSSLSSSSPAPNLSRRVASKKKAKEQQEDERQTAVEEVLNFNSAGACRGILKCLKEAVTDYSDVFSSFGDIFTVWLNPTTRKQNRAKLLEESVNALIKTYGNNNRVLAYHVCEGMPSSDYTRLVEAWRGNSAQRFYRVNSRSRNEVYNIVKESCTNLDTIGVEEGSLVAKLKGEMLKESESKTEKSLVVSNVTPQTPMQELPGNTGTVWNFLWTWSKPRINRDSLLTWQRVNHFQNARHLTRKDLLKKELHRYRSMSQYLADEFELLPDTFILPKEYLQFVDAFAQFDEVTPDCNYWIMKPVGLSRGRGISLVSDIGDVCYGQSVIIQRYLGNPLLLDGYKFDLRIYVLVTSFQPLEAWIYDEGFVRMCTHKYSSDAIDLRNLFIHLTNSSIQKLGPNGSGTKATAESISRHNADIDEAGGTKLSLAYLWRRLKAQGIDTEAIQFSIKKLILKSLVCCDDSMTNQPNSFELFGYDILIDDNLRPWLIEVNSSPSMAQENQLDTKIKRKLIADTIRLVNPMPFDRAALLEVLEKRSADIEQNRLRPFAQQSTSCSERDRLNRELTAILHGRKPRKFGEDPIKPGGYERLCPGGKVHEVVKKVLRQDRTLVKQANRKRSENSNMNSKGVFGNGKGGLQYLAEGCNIKL